ncbi:MAG: hypothetical protein KBF68_05445 [Nitrosomonas sp.]|nr:hypothetical protein [Nitrosomonas sp.]
MPLCHFAFGGLHREGNFSKQVDEFFEKILLPKQLKASPCIEFMPVLQSTSSYTGDPNSVRVIDGGITFDRWERTLPVGLLPNDVHMVSFVDIPLSKLRTWAPSEHYGKLGVVFTDKFRKNKNVYRVYYYPDFISLAHDPKVIRLDASIKRQDHRAIEELSRDVIQKRKPAKLWPEINNAFAAVKVGIDEAGRTMFEKETYSRYPEGYDFTIEQEARIATHAEATPIEFSEADVLKIIAPTEQIKSRLATLLSGSWQSVPEIILYPS